MSGTVVRRVHLCAAGVAFATVLAFWTSTVVVEAFGSTEAIIEVK